MSFKDGYSPAHFLNAGTLSLLMITSSGNLMFLSDSFKRLLKCGRTCSMLLLCTIILRFTLKNW